MLEVCIDSLESGINAIHGGADELEVCSSLVEGGLTPSFGLVKKLFHTVDGLPQKFSKSTSSNFHSDHKPKINIMLRCRSGSDFCYNKEEIATMLADLEVFKSMGVNRFVFGALTEMQDIDEETCKRIVDAAGLVPVTFHRAIDVCQDYEKGIEKVIQLGFDRLLTSGHKPSAGDSEALALISSLIERFGDKITIMPGAGISTDNARMFIDMGCKIVHSSCKRIKYLPTVKNSLAMGSKTTEPIIFVTDEKIVKRLKDIIKTGTA